MNLVFVILCLNLSFCPLFSIDFRLPCLSGVFLGFILLARAIVYRLLGLSGPSAFVFRPSFLSGPSWPLSDPLVSFFLCCFWGQQSLWKGQLFACPSVNPYQPPRFQLSSSFYRLFSPFFQVLSPRRFPSSIPLFGYRNKNSGRASGLPFAFVGRQAPFMAS